MKTRGFFMESETKCHRGRHYGHGTQSFRVGQSCDSVLLDVRIDGDHGACPWNKTHSFLWFQILFLSLSQSLRRRGAGGVLVRGYNKETRHRQHRRCFFVS